MRPTWQWLLILVAPCVALGMEVRDVKLTGSVTEQIFEGEIALTAKASQDGESVMLVTGDVVIPAVPAGDGWRLAANPGGGYRLVLATAGEAVSVKVPIVARLAAHPTGGGSLRLGLLEAPARHVQIQAPNEAYQLTLKEALGVQQAVNEGRAVVSGYLKAGSMLEVLAVPERQMEATAELLAACEVNAIATVMPGTLRVDTALRYRVNQGALRELVVKVPPDVSLTQVNGPHIRDWRLSGSDGERMLVVQLSQEQPSGYVLQVLVERSLEALPTAATVPALIPQEVTRVEGAVAIGTESAVQVQVQTSTGLSQIDPEAFPRLPLGESQPRALPEGSVFCYSFAAVPYELEAMFRDIVPEVDAETWLMVTVEDDDLTVAGRLQLEVRQAPVRRVVLAVPAGFMVSAVGGEQVADYALSRENGAVPRELAIDLQTPVEGTLLLEVRLEMGRSPLDTQVDLSGFQVQGARGERGFISVTTAKGVQVEAPETEGVRAVHTRSLPVRIAEAQYAWRFREAGWRVVLPVKVRKASIRAEAFHLLSLGDGVAYGTVVVTYYIPGAPVDQLSFQLDEGLENVEFVGLDVTRWEENDGLYRVFLRRKVIGDYNLGVTYTQRYGDDQPVIAGGVSLADVETQNGFVVAASHLNMQLAEAEVGDALIPVGTEELPEQYRLLVAAPVLGSWKYVRSPHSLVLEPQLYARGDTPPVLAEFVSAESLVSLTPDHEAESVTRVRYIIKNSSAQFLELQVPAQLNVWAARLIVTEADGQESEQRLTAAREGDLLKIPLPRQRNPNDPVTVEVEYGQLHGELGWSGHMRLELPPSPVHTTFADWRVEVPQGWALRPPAGGETMALQSEQAKQLSLPILGATLVQAWTWAFKRWLPVAMALPLLLVVALLVRRRKVIWWSAVVAFGILLFLGGSGWAWVKGTVQASPPESLAWSQVLNLSPETPLAVGLEVVPAWRWSLELGLTLGMLAVLALGLVWWWRRRSWLGAGLAVAALLVLAVQVPVGALVVGCLGTWGVPAVLLGLTLLLGFPYRPLAPATLVVAAAMALLTMESRGAEAPAAMLDSVRAQVTVQQDSAEVIMTLTHHGTQGLLVTLPVTHGIILQAPPELTRREQAYALVVPPGEYQAELRLLVPLSGPRQVTLPLPMALAREVKLTIPEQDLKVQAEQAVRLTSTEQEGRTAVEALFPSTLPVQIAWQPKVRRIEEEQTVFYATTTTLARADNGLVECFSLVQLNIAQGRLREVELMLPENQSVARVQATSLASWRFDPERHTLHLQLAEPVSGDWSLFLAAQIPVGVMPYQAEIGRLTVTGARRQRGSVGLASSESVFSTVEQHPRPVNLGDFTRDAQPLLAQLKSVSPGDVTQAWRQVDAEDRLAIRVEAVLPEIRLAEGASFSLGDDLVLYSSKLEVAIDKAGIFSLDLLVPEAYDVEMLNGPQVSHWDELPGDGERRLRVHFKQRFQGQTQLTLALSMTADRLSQRFSMPRVTVAEAVKHSGQLVVSTARGIRLAVREREGISELDVMRLPLQEKPALAFKLLRPDWRLVLEQEQVEPRINVEFLHVATITDGLVRHVHALRYRPLNAGLREFTVVVPAKALGLQVTGPEIARKEAIAGQPGHWQIELTGKWFDRVYPLQLTYETRYQPDGEPPELLPVQAVGSDLQQGYLVVKTSNRVEVSVEDLSKSLQPAEARTIPAQFGVGDLADAAFCYSANTGDYRATFAANRQAAAELLAAEVESTRLTTVVSRHGEAITRVNLRLLAGGKRYLRVQLPAGATIWSLLVDRQARRPSTSGDALLVPLPQTTGTKLAVEVELTYVQVRNAAGHRYTGPQFDLPLKAISWHFYLPEGRYYHDFEGTLALNEAGSDQEWVQDYSIDAYRDQNETLNQQDLQKAIELQGRAKELAQKGQQQAARQASEQAYNYSFNDQALNEDARVNLRRLVEQQAMVGLVSRRAGVREGEPAPTDATFTAGDAERIRSTLSKPDSENLERIVDRMTDMQEAAADQAVQLMVSLPQRGRHLVFERPLQVEPNAEMTVAFSAWEKPSGRQALHWLSLVVLALVFAGIFRGCGWLRRRVAQRPTSDEHEEVLP